MKDTKRAKIIRSLKQLVLSQSGGVSRSDAAEALHIDLRTASFYLEQLAAGGLFCSNVVAPGGKGRPYTSYSSNAGNLSFLGLQIHSLLAGSAVLIDASGRELCREKICLPENSSRLTVFSAILELVERYKQFDGKLLGGAGLAISRWLQPPLAGADVYANLADYLERESGVAIHRDVNINAVTFAIARELSCRNLAVINAGKVIEFGLVLDGVPDGDFTRREAWLSHLCVNPDGRRCYCGKHGCLENYVTSGALSERLQHGKCSATIMALGEMLGQAMLRVARKYPVEYIVLLGADELAGVAGNYFSSRAPSGVRLLAKTLPPWVDYGAALESAYYELYRFTQY
ncbi:MAG: ROK family protein [Lentisphaeria bacterium]|nr:ROK family protein [Lentisphaeria bacterium]